MATDYENEIADHLDKPKKIEQYGEQWQREANRLARSFCPTIRTCHTCGHPVVSGYCCTFCGENNP